MILSGLILEQSLSRSCGRLKVEGRWGWLVEEESRQTNLEIVQRSKQEAMTTSDKKFSKKPRNPTRSWGDLAKEDLVYLTLRELAF